MRFSDLSKGRRTFLPAECVGDPSLNAYIHKPVFAHDIIDQDTTRPGYENRKLVCPEIEYRDESDLVKFVIQTPVAYRVEDCGYQKNVSDIVSIYRKGYGNFISSLGSEFDLFKDLVIEAYEFVACTLFNLIFIFVKMGSSEI